MGEVKLTPKLELDDYILSFLFLTKGREYLLLENYGDEGVVVMNDRGDEGGYSSSLFDKI